MRWWLRGRLWVDIGRREGEQNQVTARHKGVGHAQLGDRIEPGAHCHRRIGQGAPAEGSEGIDG